MKYKDYYGLLGVKKTATADEIKKAYRALAKQYHPDANVGDAEAEDMIKEINEAYEVLGNEAKKKHYDSIVNRFNFFSGFEFDPGKFGFKSKSEFTGNADGAFIVYDITNEQSFQDVDYWHEQIKLSVLQKIQLRQCEDKHKLEKIFPKHIYDKNLGLECIKKFYISILQLYLQ